MRGADLIQEVLFSYRTLEERIPPEHPLPPLRAVVDILLRTLDAELDALYAKAGRESIPPERRLRASLIQVLFSIRSERQWVQHLDFNLLYRWLVGLPLDDAVWDHSTFSANRDRLLRERITRRFFDRVLCLAEWQNRVSDEHFSVGGRKPTVNCKGEQRSNETHTSTTDPEARLYKKSAGDKAQLCYMGHALMEIRTGLVVDVEVTQLRARRSVRRPSAG